MLEQSGKLEDRKRKTGWVGWSLTEQIQSLSQQRGEGGLRSKVARMDKRVNVDFTLWNLV